MSITVSAVYENGSLRPVTPLPMEIAEGDTVEVTVAKAEAADPMLTEAEAARRIKAAKSLVAAFGIIRAAPAWPDDYDIVKALEENRRWSAGLAEHAEAEETR